MCFSGCKEEFRPPHSKWNPEYIITKHHAPNGRVVSCGLTLTQAKKIILCIQRSPYSNLDFQVPRSQLGMWPSEDTHCHTGIQITPWVAKKMLSTFRVPLRHPPGPPEKLAPCVLHSSFQSSYIWADRAQIFCYKRTGFNTRAVNYPGHLTTATSHVSFTDGSTPCGCMSYQPTRLLQNNDTLSFVSPTFLAHTHADPCMRFKSVR